MQRIDREAHDHAQQVRVPFGDAARHDPAFNQRDGTTFFSPKLLPTHWDALTFPFFQIFCYFFEKKT
jgi:hypothetical protein